MKRKMMKIKNRHKTVNECVSKKKRNAKLYLDQKIQNIKNKMYVRAKLYVHKKDVVESVRYEYFVVLLP